MKTLIVSDTHLRNIKDNEKFAKFLLSVYKQSKYDNIVLLGDIFDYWMEYSPSHISIEYIPTVCALKKLITRGVKIKYFLGNHDWWHNDLFENMGVDMIDDEYKICDFSGKKILFSHSDRLVSTKKYKLFLTVIHNKCAIKLYRLLPPFIGDFLAKRFSSTSRSVNNSIDWGFVDSLKRWCKDKYRNEKFDIVMLGHTHQEVENDVGEFKYFNSGAWENSGVYYLFDGKIKKYYWKE